MKTLAIGLTIVVLCLGNTKGQSNKTADHVIEGGKVVVELIKVFSNKKSREDSPDCEGAYADLCVMNESLVSLTMSLHQRSSNEKREIVILPSMKECCFQIAAGVWTYDLHQSTLVHSIRKGDLRIEGCENLLMNIKL